MFGFFLINIHEKLKHFLLNIHKKKKKGVCGGGGSEFVFHSRILKHNLESQNKKLFIINKTMLTRWIRPRGDPIQIVWRTVRRPSHWLWDEEDAAMLMDYVLSRTGFM